MNKSQPINQRGLFLCHKTSTFQGLKSPSQAERLWCTSITFLRGLWLLRRGHQEWETSLSNSKHLLEKLVRAIPQPMRINMMLHVIEGEKQKAPALRRQSATASSGGRKLHKFRFVRMQLPKMSAGNLKPVSEALNFSKVYPLQFWTFETKTCQFWTFLHGCEMHACFDRILLTSCTVSSMCKCLSTHRSTTQQLQVETTTIIWMVHRSEQCHSSWYHRRFCHLLDWACEAQGAPDCWFRAGLSAHLDVAWNGHNVRASKEQNVRPASGLRFRRLNIQGLMVCIQSLTRYVCQLCNFWRTYRRSAARSLPRCSRSRHCGCKP